MFIFTELGMSSLSNKWKSSIFFSFLFFPRIIIILLIYLLIPSFVFVCLFVN